ncbi:hypothetical protein EYY86_07535 [Hafnia paralvei]|nr:hypothetical protein ERL64_17950 [Hafnia alvei]TBL55525.1 hypothetical protein EYZ00_04065 [Hafnia paralvei]TBM16338.1 hypothetical protein EYY86_07535 [Hafnia paralvei]
MYASSLRDFPVVRALKFRALTVQLSPSRGDVWKDGALASATRCRAVVSARRKPDHRQP